MPTTRKGSKREKPPGELAPLVERFGLDAEEAKLLGILWAQEHSLEEAQAARKAAGPPFRGWTVETLKAAALLEARGRLRRHGLVHLFSAHGEAAPPSAIDEVRLAPGLFRPESLAIGVQSVDAKDESHPPSPRVIQLVRGELPSPNPRVAAVDPSGVCGRREAYGLSVALARFAARPVLFADGEALMAQAVSWTVLASLRREADLSGAALVIAHAGALGERWRALAAPPPANPVHPVLLVLIGARDLAVAEGLETVSFALPLPAMEPKPDKPANREDGFDQIRQQAVRDAERALAGHRSFPNHRPAEPPPPPAASPAQPSAPRPDSTATPAPAAEAKSEALAQPVKRSRKGEMYFGAEAKAAQPAAKPSSSVEPAAGETPQELARLSTTSTDPSVRIDAINKLAAFRSPSAVAALRANVRSEHAGVREAAERAMAELFGPDWNRVRPMAKPVQPPHSED